MKYSDVKAYTLKTAAGAFNASTATAVVPVNATNIKVKFSQPVNAITYDKTAVTMTAEDTDYVITFPGTIENTISKKLDGYNTVSFSTPKPEIAINSFDVISGFDSDAEAVAAGFVANGTLQGAKLNLTNTTDAAKNVAVIYAVYASNGQLKDIVYINDSIEADTTAAFHTGVKLSETGSVKAFIWDGLTSVKPYRDATVKTIAAE